MRFVVVVDQQRCIQAGLNQNQGALMDLLSQLPSWASEKVINGKVYWHISRNKVIEEIPLFYQKADTVYRAFKSLSAKNLIEYLQENRVDYVCLTAKGKQWNKLGNKSEKLGNESEFGNESEKLGNESEFNIEANTTVFQKIKLNNSDSNPTYNNKYTNHKERGALAFLETEFPARFESWMMQHKTKIGNDFQKFTADFNDKVILDEIEWTADKLFARLGMYARNWEKNLDKANNYNQTQTESVNRPSAKRINLDD